MLEHDEISANMSPTGRRIKNRRYRISYVSCMLEKRERERGKFHGIIHAVVNIKKETGGEEKITPHPLSKISYVYSSNAISLNDVCP